MRSYLRLTYQILVVGGNRQKLFAQDVLKTLYSPMKAFEEIVKKPDAKGPFLVLLLILIITAGLQYVTATKISVEIGEPEMDDWTESTHLWTSDGEISNSSDRVVGNYSVASSVANNASIWMRLSGIGPINCSGDDSYKRLSFRIKWTHQNQAFPDSEATLKLFLNDEDDHLKIDLSAEISNSSDKWYNATVDVGPESRGWNSTDPSIWENITGLEFRLAWSASANLTMTLDDLYFGRYVPALVAFPIDSWLIDSLMLTGLGFFLSWGIYGGLLLLVIKLSGEKVGSWKGLFIVAGYLFSVTVVYLIVRVLSTAILPEAPLELVDQIWNPSWPYNIMVYFRYLGNVWTTALSVMALRSLYTFSWKKAVVISVIANVANFLLNPFWLM